MPKNTVSCRTAEHPATRVVPRLFYRIIVRPRHQAGLNDEISHSASGPDGWLDLLGDYLCLWNAKTGRAHVLPHGQLTQPGTTDDHIAAHRLACGGFDLDRVGILPFGA